MSDATMKCALVEGFGEVNENLTVVSDWPRPDIAPNKDEMLVRVLACSLAPGDARVLSGWTDRFQGPKIWPYIPGGDVCGIVARVNDTETKFKVGDCVVAQFDTVPFDGIAEYRTVQTYLAELKPVTATSAEACTLPTTAKAAMIGIERYMKKGDRVLVLGGAGGVGNALVQLAKAYGASHVAATTTAFDLVKGLGADRVIDYRCEDWWQLEEYIADPFDVIFDTVGTYESWQRANVDQGSVLTLGIEGGHYVTYTGDERYYHLHGVLDALKWVTPKLGRALWTRVWPFTRKYTMILALDCSPGMLARLFAYVDDGSLKCIVDPNGPFDFSTEGVRAAFEVLQSRRAKGKVVIKIADE